MFGERIVLVFQKPKLRCTMNPNRTSLLSALILCAATLSCSKIDSMSLAPTPSEPNAQLDANDSHAPALFKYLEPLIKETMTEWVESIEEEPISPLTLTYYTIIGL